MSAPKFLCQCVDFPGFYDAFTSLMHNNNNLSNLKCSDFLKESLPLGRDETNYAVTWGLMIKRCLPGCITPLSSLGASKLPKKTHNAW